MGKNYYHIFFRNCPHFACRANQWHEDGFLFHEGLVYEYDEDRKDQHGSTYNPRSVEDFLAYAKANDIKVPADFLNLITKKEEDN